MTTRRRIFLDKVFRQMCSMWVNLEVRENMELSRSLKALRVNQGMRGAGENGAGWLAGSTLKGLEKPC